MLSKKIENIFFFQWLLTEWEIAPMNFKWVFAPCFTEVIHWHAMKNKDSNSGGIAAEQDIYIQYIKVYSTNILYIY